MSHREKQEKTQYVLPPQSAASQTGFHRFPNRAHRAVRSVPRRGEHVDGGTRDVAPVGGECGPRGEAMEAARFMTHLVF